MVLLVVDTQTLITNSQLYRFELLVDSIKKLIGQARNNKIEVIYVRHDDGVGSELTKGASGFDIFVGFNPQENDRIFDKTVNSSFCGTGLLEYLKEKKENEVMIVGLQTDYCIDATIKSGFEHGFKMIVPAGSNSTFDNDFMTAEKTYKYYNDFIWAGRYAECISLERAMELLRS